MAYYPGLTCQDTETEMYLALAQIKERSNLEGGLRQLAALIEKYRPVRAGFYSALAEGYRAAGDRGKAVSFFEEAARRAPGSEIVWLQLGTA